MDSGPDDDRRESADTAQASDADEHESESTAAPAESDEREQSATLPPAEDEDPTQQPAIRRAGTDVSGATAGATGDDGVTSGATGDDGVTSGVAGDDGPTGDDDTTELPSPRPLKPEEIDLENAVFVLLGVALVAGFLIAALLGF